MLLKELMEATNVNLSLSEEAQNIEIHDDFQNNPAELRHDGAFRGGNPDPDQRRDLLQQPGRNVCHRLDRHP